MLIAIALSMAACKPTTTDINQTVSTSTQHAITLNAKDQDSATFTFQVTAPEYGTLSGTAPNLIYTPKPGYTGWDRFTYTASHGDAASRETPVTLFVEEAPAPDWITLKALRSRDGSQAWQHRFNPAVFSVNPPAYAKGSSRCRGHGNGAHQFLLVCEKHQRPGPDGVCGRNRGVFSDGINRAVVVLLMLPCASAVSDSTIVRLRACESTAPTVADTRNPSVASLAWTGISITRSIWMTCTQGASRDATSQVVLFLHAITMLASKGQVAIEIPASCDTISAKK